MSKKVVVRFIRENDHNLNKHGQPSKGRPIGVVVGLDKNRIGAAFWNYNTSNRLDKKFLIQLAAGRAVLNQKLDVPNKEVELAEYTGVYVDLKDAVNCSVNKVKVELDRIHFQ